MTLRHRLLLVYLIVVLLSVATVGAALFELGHSRKIINKLQYWNEIVLKVQKLRTAFERDALLRLVSGEAPPPPEDADFASLLANARNYLDFDLVRWAINVVNEQYRLWQELAARLDPNLATTQEKELLTDQTAEVRTSLNYLTGLLEREQNAVIGETNKQAARTRFLLAAVFGLTALHVVVVGWLLRRWLLRPMLQLNRQVEALARDEPPAEPLLATPLEMANLAQALDRARRSLGELRRQLIESERLTTIGQFAAQLAHNLRNPLASIRAAAQVTARRRPESDDLRERMNEIVASVDRLNRWIEGLMEVARREPTPTRIADVVPILHRVRDALAGELATKELTLDIQAPEGGLACPHDPDTLEHALVAMVINAIEASPLSETITLRAQPIAGDGRRPAVCRIAVVDRGTGLPTGTPDEIFEFSFSTKQRGMGLGLALARLALERQGGSARAENNPQGGATIYVELPTQTECGLSSIL